jgi:serine/threonine protein kinase
MPISEEARDFIQVCLKKDPRDRYTVPELLEHPFIMLKENPTLSELA